MRKASSGTSTIEGCLADGEYSGLWSLTRSNGAMVSSFVGGLGRYVNTTAALAAMITTWTEMPHARPERAVRKPVPVAGEDLAPFLAAPADEHVPVRRAGDEPHQGDPPRVAESSHAIQKAANEARKSHQPNTTG